MFRHFKTANHFSVFFNQSLSGYTQHNGEKEGKSTCSLSHICNYEVVLTEINKVHGYSKDLVCAILTVTMSSTMTRGRTRLAKYHIVGHRIWLSLKSNTWCYGLWLSQGM